MSVATQGLRQRIRQSRAESARLETRIRELTVLADRDRIGRDLQDLAVRRLFTAGLSLQGVMSLTVNPAATAMLGSATDDLDEAVKAIRRSIGGARLAWHVPARG